MKTRKCTSSCSHQKNCRFPQCVLTRSYCRIPYTHKFDDNCKVVLRKKRTPLSQMKRTPDFLLRGKSGECVAFGQEAYLWLTFFKAYTFTFAEEVSPVPQGHEILYVRDGFVSYALLTPFDIGIQMNHLVTKFPCFLYTYGLFYSPLSSFTVPQLNSLTEGSGNPYLLTQHLHDAVPLSHIPPQERLPILFILYHAWSSISIPLYLTLDNVVVWKPHPTKYIQYHYPKLQFQSPYLPKITYKAFQDTSGSLTEEIGRTGTPQEIYKWLKTQMKPSDHDVIGTITVSKTRNSYKIKI
jgi:hypothetical protein